MPIVVSHQPDPAFLARAGYVSGLGEFQQRQQEMAQRERMQIRGIEANQQSQVYSTNAAFAQQNLGFQQQGQLAEMQGQRQKEMFDLQRKDKFDMFKMEMDQRRQNMELENESFINRDIARFYLGQVDNTRGQIEEMLADGFEFTPEGQKQWESLQQELGRIQEDGTITPAAKAEAMYKLMLQKSPIPNMKRPEFNEEVDKNTVWKEDPVTGQRVLVGRAREYSVLANSDPQEAAQQPPTFREFIKSGTDEARKEKARLEKMAVDLLTEEVPIPGDLTGETKTKQPTLQDINRWIERYIDHQDGTTFPEPQYGREETQQMAQQMQRMRQDTVKSNVRKWTMKDGVQ